MTSTPVMGSQGLQDVNFMNLTQPKPNADLGDFKSFLDNQNANDAATVNPTNANAKKQDVNSNEATKEPKEAKAVKDEADTKVDNTTKADNKVDAKDVDKVKDAVEKVVEEIKEKFEITDEELLNVMEILGLNFIDLLNSENIPDIAVEVFNLSDKMSLLTDENVYSAVVELTDAVNEEVNNLSEELGVEPEEIIEAVKNFDAVSFSETLNVKADENETAVITNEEPVTYREKPLQERISFSKENVNASNNEVKPEESVQRPVENRPKEHDSQNLGKGNENNFNFLANLVKETAAALEAATEIQYTEIDVQNIIDQITEQIKVNVSEETSSIELRLHPESLGNVSVKVSANHEGVMTAQFIAQNETVKGIIETQTVVLKETLESKGVTVEAVEVMVESHAFEQNLNSRNNNGEESEGRPNSRRIRRINLDEVSEEETVIDDSDRLTKEMMAINGNTIDYTA